MLLLVAVDVERLPGDVSHAQGGQGYRKRGHVPGIVGAPEQNASVPLPRHLLDNNDN